MTAPVAVIAGAGGGGTATALSLADAAVICARDYVSFRAPEVIDWRAAHPALARWADRVGARESARRTAPPKPGETVFEGQTFRPGVV